MTNAGVTKGPIDSNQVTYTAITIMIALAWYNLLELNFLIFNTFKRYRGLYFWSLLISSWGTSLHGLGFILKFFPTGTNVYLACAIVTIGWYSMVTGQSVVLYSRVHIVVQNPKVLKRVLTMIIVDAILFHIPTTVLTFGANSTTGNANLFTFPYEVMEKVQMTAFSVQELIISIIYVRAAIKLFRPLYEDGMQKPMVELLIVNVMIICMDITLLGVEYASLYDLEVVMKTLIYSIKLKLEFAVLTELKSYAGPTHDSSHVAAYNLDGSESATRRRSSATQGRHFGRPSSYQSPRQNESMFHGGILKTVSADVTSVAQRDSAVPLQLRRRRRPLEILHQASRPFRRADLRSTDVGGFMRRLTSSETELAPYPQRAEQKKFVYPYLSEQSGLDYPHR